MRALDRKFLRDTWHLSGQLLAVAAVVACGVATMLSMRANYDSLLRSRDAYYDRRHFAQVFAHLRRAPERVALRLRELPGVAAAEPRVVADVTLDVPGLAEPASGRLVSISAADDAGLNAVHLRAGRLPAPDRPDEVVASEIFAEKNGLVTGDSVAAVINGRWRPLAIVGIGLSPEYIYELGPGQVFPDNRRFGVLWMQRDALGAAFDLTGAFNDVTLTLEPGTDVASVVSAVDRLLGPWGGSGAFPRDDQLSHELLTAELEQHRVTGGMIGYLFLAVAAFLLHLVLARVLATQRDQIGVLKAFGYRDATLALHYLVLALVPMLVGLVAGILMGTWLGRYFTALFARIYRFPVLEFVLMPRTVLIATLATVLAGFAATLQALHRVTRLPPAEAMRPEAPATYRRGAVERIAITRLGTTARMVARSLARRPAKATLTVVGLGLACGLLVLGRFFGDTMDRMSEIEFHLVQRQDALVTFNENAPLRVRHELGRLPGVLGTELFHTVPVHLIKGPLERRTMLMGLSRTGELRQLVDVERHRVSLPVDGIAIDQRLATRLRVRAGDSLMVEVQEGRRLARPVVVARVYRSVIGDMAYADTSVIHMLTGETPLASGAFLVTDPDVEATLAARLKALPHVAGVGFRRPLIESFEVTVAENMRVSNLMLTVFASVIAIAIVYNGLRIALSERSRELASLRVLGFTERQVGAMLVGEFLLLTLVGIPLGFLVGYGFCTAIAVVFETDLYRIPLVVSRGTYAYATGVMLVAFVATAATMARRVGRLDLVAALKMRE
jgi:putative ABC transport system permease protein